MLSSDCSSAYYLNQRLSYDDNSCTVRYIGPVSGTKGQWLGVEWDDPGRGKHDGEHGGVRYFTCLSGEPSAGSFVRPQRKPDTPRTFLEALRFKYRGDPDRKGEIFKSSVFISAKKNGKASAPSLPGKQEPVETELQYKPIKIGNKVVEQVGFDAVSKRLAQLEKLTTVVLDGFRISRHKESENEEQQSELKEIPNVCPKIRELNLSKNLWEEWTDVLEICDRLENIEALTADLNRFQLSDRQVYIDAIKKPKHFFSVLERLKTLSLERTYLSWEDYSVIVASLSRLENLSLSYNHLTVLTPPPAGLSLTNSIQMIDLTANNFESLEALRPLSKLPNLSKLDIRRNNISQVYGSQQSKQDELAIDPLVFSTSLSQVNLSHNSISSWFFIDSLESVFPGLKSLNSNGNPLFNFSTFSLSQHSGTAPPKILSADDCYMLTIAHLGKLETLNYADILPQDRFNAETYYLSLIGKEISAAPEELEEEIASGHPRWRELCEKYSRPVIRRRVEGSDDANTNSLWAQLRRIQVKVPSAVEKEAEVGATTGQDGFMLEVPAELPVHTLVALIARRSGLRVGSFDVVWETGELVRGGLARQKEEKRDEKNEDGDAVGDTGPNPADPKDGPASALEGDQDESKVGVCDGDDDDDDDDEGYEEGLHFDIKGHPLSSGFREVVIEPSTKPIEMVFRNLAQGAVVRIVLK